MTWGAWSFTPASGEDLTPEQGQVTIRASVVTPDEDNTEFEGELRIVNQDNSSDFVVVPVHLTTPLCHDLPFECIFERMFQRFPYAFPLLRHLFGYT